MGKFIFSLMMEITERVDISMIIGHLEQLFMQGKITEDEYRKKKAEYIDTLYELYIKDIITEKELKEKLNK